MEGNTTYNYSYDADQELTSMTHGSNPVVTDFAYEYDQNGQGKNGWQTRRNLGTGTDYDLVYDAAGQLRKVLTHGTTTVLFTYAYDGLGRRSSRKVGTGSTHEMLCELGLVAEEWVSPNVVADYGYGLDLFRRNSEFAVWDGHGDLRNSLSVDANYVASVVSTSVYDAFGNRVAYDNSTGHGTYIPNQYCGLFGYRKDGDDPSTQTTSTGDAGLMHVGARYYDAAVGQFASTDPLYVEPPFGYCAGNPVALVDPTGLLWALPCNLLLGGDLCPTYGAPSEDPPPDWWEKTIRFLKPIGDPGMPGGIGDDPIDSGRKVVHYLNYGYDKRDKLRGLLHNPYSSTGGSLGDAPGGPGYYPPKRPIRTRLNDPVDN